MSVLVAVTDSPEGLAALEAAANEAASPERAAHRGQPHRRRARHLPARRGVPVEVVVPDGGSDVDEVEQVLAGHRGTFRGHPPRRRRPQALPHRQGRPRQHRPAPDPRGDGPGAVGQDHRQLRLGARECAQTVRHARRVARSARTREPAVPLLVEDRVGPGPATRPERTDDERHDGAGWLHAFARDPDERPLAGAAGVSARPMSTFHCRRSDRCWSPSYSTTTRQRRKSRSTRPTRRPSTVTTGLTSGSGRPARTRHSRSLRLAGSSRPARGRVRRRGAAPTLPRPRWEVAAVARARPRSPGRAGRASRRP